MSLMSGNRGLSADKSNKWKVQTKWLSGCFNILTSLDTNHFLLWSMRYMHVSQNTLCVCVCVCVCWCDKHQKQCEEERAFFILEVTVHYHSELHGRNLEAECGTESMEDHCSLACFAHLLSSDTPSHPPPPDRTVHCGLGPPASIRNQGNAGQACPKAIWSRQSLIETPSYHLRILRWHLKLTRT